jgi:hypothetical protein
MAAEFFLGQKNQMPTRTIDSLTASQKPSTQNGGNGQLRYPRVNAVGAHRLIDACVAIVCVLRTLKEQQTTGRLHSSLLRAPAVHETVANFVEALIVSCQVVDASSDFAKLGGSVVATVNDVILSLLANNTAKQAPTGHPWKSFTKAMSALLDCLELSESTGDRWQSTINIRRPQLPTLFGELLDRITMLEALQPNVEFTVEPSASAPAMSSETTPVSPVSTSKRPSNIGTECSLPDECVVNSRQTVCSFRRLKGRRWLRLEPKWSKVCLQLMDDVLLVKKHANRDRSLAYNMTGARCHIEDPMERGSLRVMTSDGNVFWLWFDGSAEEAAQWASCIRQKAGQVQEGAQ